MIFFLFFFIGLVLPTSDFSGQRVDADINPVTKQRFKYDHSFKDFSKVRHEPNGIVIFGYNRPHYFKEVIDALAANPESQLLPVFFILDGGKSAKQKEYVELIAASKIKKKYIIKRPVNYGLHFNLISGLRFLFDWCGFERIIHFEDDVVVTPSYIGLMLKLDAWAFSNYDNIGAVQGFRPCRMTLADKKSKQNIVAETPGLWLGYCLRKTVWDDIKDIMYDYEQKFLGRRKLPADLIRKWMYSKLSVGPTKKKIAQARTWESPPDPYYENLPEMGVGQCGMLTMSLFLKGYVRLTTLVNRAITVGVEGANYKSKRWHRHFDGITLDFFKTDAKLSVFEPLMKVVY